MLSMVYSAANGMLFSFAYCSASFTIFSCCICSALFTGDRFPIGKVVFLTALFTYYTDRSVRCPFSNDFIFAAYPITKITCQLFVQ